MLSWMDLHPADIGLRILDPGGRILCSPASLPTCPFLFPPLPVAVRLRDPADALLTKWILLKILNHSSIQL